MNTGIKIISFLLISSFGLVFGSIPWPHPPQDSVHPIGNSWGLFQDYGGTPYLHNGNDIMTPPLWPVTAVRYGYVKKVWTTGNPLYNGITIGDSAGSGFCSGYMYYHIDPNTITVQEGDTVYPGETIGRIVTWPVAEFHHNHFSKNRNSGVIWPSYGTFYKNPLAEFIPDNDSTVPNFLNAISGQKFAICLNNRSTYLNPDSVYGDCDLICRLEDKINHRVWKVAVYKISYSIRDTLGNYVVPLKLSFQFSESIEAYYPGQCRTVYKDDAVCNSNCDYDSLARRLYYIFTNTDGDPLIEGSDSLECWRTSLIPDGPYWIKVMAEDEFGNRVQDSMLVRVKNRPNVWRDVGVLSIVAPGGEIDSGLSFVPACTLYNYGNTTESYRVRMKVGSFYNDTARITNHSPGTKVYLIFPIGNLSVPRGIYPVTCSTELVSDTNRRNDKREGQVLVRVLDAQAGAILSPVDSLRADSLFVPKGLVRNLGNTTVNFPVSFLIQRGVDTLYQKRINITFLPESTALALFPETSFSVLGWYYTQLRTELAGDRYPGNDRISDSFRIYQPPSGVLEGKEREVISNPLKSDFSLLVLEGFNRIEIYNILGEVLYSMTLSGEKSGRIKIPRLPVGIYILNFTGGEKREERKVIIFR
uniref:T9SS type A sorting domain-containing protein n=1 Tax=candidate division WOR-3 bacterium TaxID=2052148 RepID=A0A7C3YUU5_UNCW3